MICASSEEAQRPLFGAHISVAGGVEKAFPRADALGCRAIQIFTRNANRWQAPPIDETRAEAFRTAWENSGVGPVMAHDSDLINLASPDDAAWDKSCNAFLEEMQRCHQLGIAALVMHPGAHVGSGEDAGIARVCEALRRIFAVAPHSVTVLLENTAGQGSCLGARFEHLAAIMDGVPGGRFGVCFDTCHAFAAGYDLSEKHRYRKVMNDFERCVGLERIEAFHVNDSRGECGSRLDRHAHIGEGAIGEAGFRELVQDPCFAGVPMILETPKGESSEWDMRNLATLRRLAGERD